METFTIEKLNFAYPNRSEWALYDLSFSIQEGQFVALCGKSGSGKSTLLRQLKTVLSPHGKREGKIFFEGELLETIDQRIQAQKIGYVLQSPENQIVTDKVWHELAFGLESLGYETPTIRRKVAEMASFFGIQNWFHKSVTELSGGQKQLLNLASIMAMEPSVLILDEPTSQLDPIAASDFLATIGKINRELGTTIIISEHRLEEVLPFADRLLVMENGKIIADDAPKTVGEKLKAEGHEMFLAMPAPMRIYAAIENTLSCPITIREGRYWLDRYVKEHPIVQEPSLIEKEGQKEEKPIIEGKDLWFKYEKEGEDIVKGLSLKIYPGELYTIVGGNGTGKTTTLSLLSGIYKPYRGKILIDGVPLEKIADKDKFEGLFGILPQNPQSLFVKKTVELDLYEMFQGRKIPKEEQEEKIREVVSLCEIGDLLSFHPYDLSGGEQQRAALAKVLLLEPAILILDEPTKGLDGYFKKKFAAILRKLQNMGTTIIMVSHDVEFSARYADRCAMFFDGSIVSEGEPKSFFSGNSFYTTQANRMARHLLPKAVTAEDVILALGGKVDKTEDILLEEKDNQIKKNAARIQTKIKVSEPSKEVVEKENRKLSKRTLTAMFMILLLIPLTIWFGIYYLADRKYYFISLLMILEIMLPFVMIFEDRKPQARELLVIAVLCALGVAGRIAFFWLPQFKPVAAIVIIAGVCFGGETGFLVGAVTGFVSNFYFGQSPNTPWQMFAFGIVGFLAGVLYKKGLIKRNKISLCVFGALAVFFIYGGIMNPASVLTRPIAPTWEMFALAYVMGIPFDLIHAVATAIFLYFITNPMIEKLDRIKEKYGLIEP